MRTFLPAMALFLTTILGTTPAFASNVVLLDITISGLENFDLTAFDLDVNFDENEYDFHGYFPTDALGSISFGDAVDWSTGYVSDSGSVNIAVLSYLEDFSLQPSEFTLATLVFDGVDATTLLNNTSSGFSVAVNDLSDALGDPIPFSVSGTEINVVPVPAAAWLLGSGLIGLVAFRRR